MRPDSLCDVGIRPFLDVGSGLSTSPNVYEIAQQADPGARRVYVENDPVVFLHAEALMFVASLHHLEDHDDPAGVVASYLDAMAPNADRVMAYGSIAAL